MAQTIIGKGYIVTNVPGSTSVADAIGSRVYWSQRGALAAAERLSPDFAACQQPAPFVVRVYEVATGYSVSDRGAVHAEVRS